MQAKNYNIPIATTPNKQTGVELTSDLGVDEEHGVPPLVPAIGQALLPLQDLLLREVIVWVARKVELNPRRLQHGASTPASPTATSAVVTSSTAAAAVVTSSTT